MHYSAMSNGFYQSKNLAPSDAVDITDEEYVSLLKDAAKYGREIGPDQHGRPYLLPLPDPMPIADILDQFKKDIRPIRNKILADVVQIALVSKALGDEAVAAEVLTPDIGLRDRLRDITDDPSLNSAASREEMESAVVAYYSAIVSGVSPELRNAFKELEK